MNKFLLILLASAMTLTTSAQQKRLSHLLRERKNHTTDLAITYDNSGRVTKMVSTSESGSGEDKEISDVSYDGNAVTIYLTGYSPNGSQEYTDIHKFTLENNRVTKYVEIIDSDGIEDINDFVYNGDRLWKTVISYTYQGMTFSQTGEVIWTGNNLSESISYITPDNILTRATLTPGSLTADPLSRCLFGLGMYYEHGIVFYKNFGELPENLISSVQTVYYNEDGYTVNTSYAYELDSDGYVKKVIEDNSDVGLITYTLVWEANTAAIDTIKDDSPEPQNIYNLQGTMRMHPTRGLNIIRMSDGTTRKVIVR